MTTKNRKPDSAEPRDAAFMGTTEDQAAQFTATEPPLADVARADAAPPRDSELATAHDRILRLQAEMQNLRNRTAREIADERRYAALPVLRELLPVVDNIERAIEAAEKAGEAENLLAGFRLVRQQLMTVLNNHHCELIVAEGQPFDPNVHQAILQQPSAEAPAGQVTLVTQAGYRLHDRVVRPAQVIVSSGPPPA